MESHAEADNKQSPDVSMQTVNKEPELLSIRQARELLRCADNTYRRAVKALGIKPAKDFMIDSRGNHVACRLYTLDDVMRVHDHLQRSPRFTRPDAVKREHAVKAVAGRKAKNRGRKTLSFASMAGDKEPTNHDGFVLTARAVNSRLGARKYSHVTSLLTRLAALKVPYEERLVLRADGRRHKVRYYQKTAADQVLASVRTNGARKPEHKEAKRQTVRTMSSAAAAGRLGVTISRVGQLVLTGHLQRSRYNRITVDSVRAELDRRKAKRAGTKTARPRTSKVTRTKEQAPATTGMDVKTATASWGIQTPVQTTESPALWVLEAIRLNIQAFERQHGPAHAFLDSCSSDDPEDPATTTLTVRVKQSRRTS